MFRLTSLSVILPSSFFQLLDVAALLADDDTGTGGIDRDAAQLRALDHHLRDRRLRQRLEDELADLQVLEQQATIVLPLREPAAVPGPVDLERRPTGDDF